MAQKLTLAALDVLARLDRLGLKDSSPAVPLDIAAELCSRGFAVDSLYGLRITDIGREYLHPTRP
jgi:hypothetical protein